MNQQWYAVYTKSDAEAKLRDCINRYSKENALPYEVYLPLRQEFRQWSDRKKKVEKALFKNYLFVKHDERGFAKIKKMPGFVSYVQFGKYPSVVPEQDIELIKTVTKHDKAATSKTKTLVKGDKVRIKSGALAEYEGILLKDANGNKVAIRVDNLNQYLQVSVPLSNIELI